MAELEEKLLRIFVRLAREKTPIRLLNTFKGYPISNDALILSVSQQGLLRVQTHKRQVLCLNFDHETIILGDVFPGYCKARAERIDMPNCQTDLTRLQYIQEKLIQRETARVVPRESTAIWVTLKENSFRIKCELADISLEGMAVWLPIEFFVPNRIRQGAEILLTFELPIPGSSQMIEIRGSGTIRNTLGAAGYQQKRVGIRTQYERPHNYQISQYIQLRILEIMREMDMTYTALTRLSQAGTN